MKFLIYAQKTVGFLSSHFTKVICALDVRCLKFKNLSLKNNWVQYLFLVGSVALIVYFQTKALALIIAWYLVLSAIIAVFSKKAKNQTVA